MGGVLFFCFKNRLVYIRMFCFFSTVVVGVGIFTI